MTVYSEHNRTTDNRSALRRPTRAEHAGDTAVLIRLDAQFSRQRLWAWYRLARQKAAEVPLLSRFTAHVIVLLLVTLTGVVGTADHTLVKSIDDIVTEVTVPAPWAVNTEQPPRIGQKGLDVPLVTQSTTRADTGLVWQTVDEAFSIRQERPAVARQEPVIYKVQPGDNPYLIGQRFGLQPESIVWANPELEENPDLLSIDQQLVIPPTDGVLHTVEAGDSLTSIADDYGVAVADITAYTPNDLQESSSLVEGQWVMVPGGEKPLVQQQAASAPAAQWAPSLSDYGGATGSFMWPVSGRLTQGPHAYHMALDLANATGTPIAAADAGVVIFSGWDSTGYGYSVVIDHGNGFRTRYAHMSYYLVEAGQQVGKGDLIGKVGNTGRSTGSHLHFETIYNGVRRNPYEYLP